MSWDKRASKGTIGNRDKTIKLSDSYTIKWEDYSDKYTRRKFSNSIISGWKINNKRLARYLRNDALLYKK